MLGNIKEEDQKGIIPRACSHILTRIASDKSNYLSFRITCSFIEIYNEKIFDLMETIKTKKDLKVCPKIGVFVQGLK